MFEETFYTIKVFDNKFNNTGFGKVITIPKKGQKHFQEKVLVFLEEVKEPLRRTDGTIWKWRDWMSKYGEGGGYYINSQEDWDFIEANDGFLGYKLGRVPDRVHKKIRKAIK